MLRMASVSSLIAIGFLYFPNCGGAYAQTKSQAENGPQVVAGNNSDSSESPRDTGYSQQAQKNAYTVSVTRMPDKDTFDRVSLYVNTGLFVVGLATVGVGLWTLRRIRIFSQRQLRAYIVPGEEHYINNVADVEPDIEGLAANAKIVNPNIGPHIGFTIKNVGQTPSYDVIHTFTISIRTFPIPAAGLPNLPADGPPSVMILGPGISAHSTVNLPNPLQPLEIENLKAGLAAIYLVGVIEYSDVFGRSHATHYQMMHHARNGKIGFSTKLVCCNEGNYGD